LPEGAINLVNTGAPMVIDLWVNALSSEAAAAFLGKSGFASVEGFFGVDVREGITPLDLVAEMDRVGVGRAVLSTALSRVDDDTLAFAAEHRERPVSWRYDAIGKPLWSKASGFTRLEDLGNGKTRVYFRETYDVFNPLMRALFEKRVHHFISKGNDKLIEASLVRTLEKLHARKDIGPT
jgi:hypothetical protein